jgi:hypothetical protein
MTEYFANTDRYEDYDPFPNEKANGKAATLISTCASEIAIPDQMAGELLASNVTLRCLSRKCGASVTWP